MDPITQLGITAAVIFAAIFAALFPRSKKEEVLPDILFIPKAPVERQNEPETRTPQPVPPTAPVSPKAIDYGFRSTLVKALIKVESGGVDTAIGDRHLKDMAYGCLQIRKPVCIDVNRTFGTALTPKMMLGNRQLSIDTFYRYMTIYATTKRLGRTPTDEDRARMWNGGPSAWRPGNALYTATTGYWGKVRKHL